MLWIVGCVGSTRGLSSQSAIPGVFAGKNSRGVPYIASAEGMVVIIQGYERAHLIFRGRPIWRRFNSSYSMKQIWSRGKDRLCLDLKEGVSN